MNVLDPWSPQQSISASNLSADSTESARLASIVNSYRPNLTKYEEFYRQVHQKPEISGLESETAALVADHLRTLGFEVHTHIGGEGVVGILHNGPGKTILNRAELDAPPILEPVMHACGHDMNMATLLGASNLLKAASREWSGTLIALFQPDEEETGGAQAMIDDGLYSKVPIPDLLLGQHVVTLHAGQIAAKSGPVLVAADSINVRITGGPYENSLNPQICLDPIPLAMHIISERDDYVHERIGADEDVTVACWGFHAGVPGNDYVAYADIPLDVKTVKADVRKQALRLIEDKIKVERRTAGTPKEPQFNYSVRAPLTENNDKTTARIQAAFHDYFGSDSVPMRFTRACEDFSLLTGGHNVPHTYWNFGGSPTTDGEIPTNHSPFFAPAIEPTLEAGVSAMALAVLAFSAS
ncbi:metal-dependent amidase/aminoacylase/carboxypeptidase [Karstenula rhodostoma CBS 690.94]|uniref:Metal-dependent amidase/aminoacylase/carboxypeptidase n=1 Tax=Karstenula rhodostoma CBS 690.94 TaxID=1392251 RepID=A0A9P4U430_9PLEO|nr:metal-dependent amidase/aminoacylase/carboxypeptidase [Karstenula rhodostoma CBS 690.94]